VDVHGERGRTAWCRRTRRNAVVCADHGVGVAVEVTVSDRGRAAHRSPLFILNAKTRVLHTQISCIEISSKQTLKLSVLPYADWLKSFGLDRFHICKSLEPLNTNLAIF
jgi:hypothetical protein